jgi:hypothetical protein
MRNHLVSLSLSTALLVLAAAGCTAASPEGVDSAGQAVSAVAPACGPAVVLRAPGALAALSQLQAETNATCNHGYTWCSVSSLRAYDAPACAAAQATLATVAAAVEADSPMVQSEGQSEESATLTRAELLQRTSYTFRDPQLLAKIDAYAGSTNVVAMEIGSELSCENCHESAVRYVLFYADTQAVIVLDGTYGYDS